MRIINVMATSIDGCIALKHEEPDHQRLAYGFTNLADRQLLEQELYRCDAVIIGARSVRSAGGLRITKNYRGKYPLWAVLTRSGDMGDKFWQQNDIERWLFAPAPLAERQGVSYHYYDKDQNPALYVYQSLQAHGIKTALLFGGGEVNCLFYQQQLVDELSLTICPFIFAGATSSRLIKANLAQPVALQLKSCKQIDQHLFLRYHTDYNR